ncbi:hypothetical protein [Agromyces luteolus]|uniref:Uncharacterized protein n=1 Tax=Agromyces luteolus TaxID=88373 RepID=A0A7C9HGE7_9MICO|nr:hypothetical protein [Agromyces luteolus]MUN06268.1 hypothetical protein [Agromyces luteolus]
MFKALGKDPRYQLISAWVSVGLSPFFVFIFWVLAQTLSPWFWMLVAAAAVNFAHNIWLVVKYRRAFRQETPAEARLHAE